jgi:hypothetical protein
MKGMADKLRSLGDELPDRHLVLQMWAEQEVYHMKALIKRTKPLPNFHVRNDFKLEELDIKIEVDLASTRRRPSPFCCPTC